MKPTGDYTVHFADPDMYVPLLLTENNESDSRLSLLSVAGYLAGHHSTLHGLWKAAAGKHGDQHKRTV